MNLPRRLILDQKVQCLATTDTSYLADVFLLSHVFVYPHNFNHFLLPSSQLRLLNILLLKSYIIYYIITLDV